MWETLNAKETWRGEFQNRKKNGKLYWEKALISPICDAAGGTSHFIAIKEDITQSKQAEAHIRKLSLAIEQSPA
ncbi:MAG: PAS domain S-box protein, partial [Desulfofustis sp.]|nr:PAS domain S-box protein [Desulfofustis sp.]